MIENNEYSSTVESDNHSHLIFIDSNVNNYQNLITNNSNVEVIILHQNDDGITQISEALAQYTNVDTVEIIAHGQAGSLDLGNSQLNLNNLNSYTADLQNWGNSLSDRGDILIYGCNVAGGEDGQTFVEQLSVLTNADIAASNDLTGSSILGGDWELEFTTGAIESSSAISTIAQNNFNSVLVSFNGNEYQLTTGATTWEEAQAEAESLGGNLITINDGVEQQWVSDTFGSTEVLWIGLADQTTEGQFTWASGSNASYSNWIPGQPDDFGGAEDFAVINWNSGDGRWNDIRGEANFRGIIEIGGDNPTEIEPEIFTYNGNEYRLTTSAQTWSDAQAEAESLGGNLITVNDATEQQWIVDTFGSTEVLWLGLTDQNTEGQFTWASGSNASYSNWIPGQPDDFGGAEDFAVINWNSGDSRWNDIRGEASFRGIIEIGNDNPVPVETFFNSGSEYRLTTSAKTWLDAQAEAESLGGNLITINDVIEQQWVSETFGTEERLWIGYSDRNTEGEFVWADNEFVDYNNWQPGQPDDFGGAEDFVVINWEQGSGKWNDVRGEANFRGIIEIKRPTGDITLETDSYTVNEDDGTVAVKVFRVGGDSSTVTVDYQTVDGSATANQDYSAISGTLTFAPGETSKTINIAIANDTTAEANESFNLIIDNVSNPSDILDPRTASIAIVDDDGGSFNLDNFSDLSDLTLNGNARQAGNDLRLTTTADGVVGSAFFNDAIVIDGNTSFQTQFQFQLGGASATEGASGFTFMLQNSNAALSALGGTGVGLGYEGINNSLAIEFDNFDSGNFDPNNNHLSIISNGDVRNPLATINAPFDLNSGASLNAWIDYDGNNNLLSVFLSDDTIKPNSAILTQNVALNSLVGDRAFAGFSAATGFSGVTNTHNINNWNFSSSSDFFVPPPTRDLLPDLQVIGSSVTEGLRIDTTEEPGRVLLRFTTEVGNSGDGPLEVWADEVQNNTQPVFQRIYQNDGSSRDVAAGGFSYFEPHGHSHFDDFATYNLRQINPDNSVGELVATGDEKFSFCLINIRQPFPELTNNATIVDGRGGNSCGDIQGISVGYSDVYNSGLPNQWIDVTNVPDGTYWLETIIDPQNRLLETNENNNTTLVQVTVDNPNFG